MIDDVSALLRARLTPDVAGYAREVPVSPAFGRLLQHLGWTLLRFTNAEVECDLSVCVADAQRLATLMARRVSC